MVRGTWHTARRTRALDTQNKAGQGTEFDAPSKTHYRPILRTSGFPGLFSNSIVPCFPGNILNYYPRGFGMESQFPVIRDGNLKDLTRRRRPKMGRRDPVIFVPEVRQRVYELACEGKSKEDIAALIGVTTSLLWVRCKKEIKKGSFIAKANNIKVNINETENDCLLPTDAQRFQIQCMAAIGLKNDQIAIIMNISLSTLQTQFQEDIYMGRAKGIEKVAGVLYDMAVDRDHPNETKFFLKTQAGWREATQIEFPDKDGNPQDISTKPMIEMSAEKMQVIVNLLNEKV